MPDGCLPHPRAILPRQGQPLQLFCKHNGEATSCAQASFSRHNPRKFKRGRALPKLASRHRLLRVNKSPSLAPSLTLRNRARPTGPARPRVPPQQPLVKQQPLPTWYEGSGVYWTIRPCIWLPIPLLWLLRRPGGCACCTPIILCIWPPMLFLWLLRSPGGCACCTPITPWYVCCWLDITGCKPVGTRFKWHNFLERDSAYEGSNAALPHLLPESGKRASLTADVKHLKEGPGFKSTLRHLSA